jgi:thiol-disulfide isomerase/thioredoxin
MIKYIETDEQLKDEVAKLLPGDLVLLTAPKWCMPCRQLAPHIKALGDDVDILYIDIDNLSTYGYYWPDVRSVPTLLEWGGNTYRDIKSRTFVSIKRELDANLIR